mmetsp:Transcript_23732/g.27994  ORF Transcript_23732/g.27994 Transcript_23732/m.27994 type:complete len:173 (+) Transcript_23732:59-577(+)
MLQTTAIVLHRTAILRFTAKLMQHPIVTNLSDKSILNGKLRFPYGLLHYTTSEYSREGASVSRSLSIDATTTTNINTESIPASKTKNLYLHVSPDGDWWTGHELFAAKHLQPDYVKSIVLPDAWLANKDADDVEAYIEEIYDGDELEKLMREIYDTGSLPSRVIERYALNLK